MIHKLSQRVSGGEPNNWLIVRYKYDTALSIQVQLSLNESHNQIVPSLPLGTSVSFDNKTSECGSNIFFNSNK